MTPSRIVKALWRKADSHLPLKEWARQNSNLQEVMDWFANKSGLLEKKAKDARFKLKGARIAAEKLATKNSRKA